MPATRSPAAMVADVTVAPYWLDRPDRPSALPPLTRHVSADLVVVGGGFTGLWTALLAKEREPDRDVVLLEGGRIGWGASGRNGGFCSASLTHGLANAVSRHPDEARQLLDLGKQNLTAIEEAVLRYGIDCAFERRPYVTAATAPWQLPQLREAVELAERFDEPVRLLSAEEVRQRVDSPTYVGGMVAEESALVDPARLAWGLAAAAQHVGVTVFETSPALSLARQGTRVVASTRAGSVTAPHAALATNAFRPLARRHRAFVVPVYNYALMTEPLSDQQLARIGWTGREGMSDAAAEFSYYRLTQDHRILWGGPHTDYFHGGRIHPRLENRPQRFLQLAADFLRTFPQLADVTFSHAWGGVIDICSRGSAFWDTSHGGRVATALGFSGLGVGSSRFAAEVLLDLISGRETERTAMRFVRERPLPFPPEPLRVLGVAATKRSITQSDRKAGRRNLWLRSLDRIGLGFDG